MIRILEGADQGALDAFLATAPAYTMMLRSNLRASGLDGVGGLYTGTYAAKFDAGKIVAAAAHYQNGNIVFFAPGAATALARVLAQHTKRPIMGLIGPWADCIEAVEGLAVQHRTIDQPPHQEILYDLDLVQLVMPQSDGVICRRATRDDLPTLIPWRINYEMETLRYARSPQMEQRAAAAMQWWIDQRNCWVASVDGALVAMTAFGATLPDMVQVGGVHTPKAHRGKGYARAAVARSLMDARTEGVARGILFTEIENYAAQKVYESLGFKQIGDYGLILLHPET